MAHCRPALWQSPEGANSRSQRGQATSRTGSQGKGSLSATGGRHLQTGARGRDRSAGLHGLRPPSCQARSPSWADVPLKPGFRGSSDTAVERSLPCSLTPMPPTTTINVPPNSRSHDPPPESGANRNRSSRVISPRLVASTFLPPNCHRPTCGSDERPSL